MWNLGMLSRRSRHSMTLKVFKIKCFKQSCWFGAYGLRYFLCKWVNKWYQKSCRKSANDTWTIAARRFSYSDTRLCEFLVCWFVEVYTVKPRKCFQIECVKPLCWFETCGLIYSLWKYGKIYHGSCINLPKINNRLFCDLATQPFAYVQPWFIGP